MAAKTAKATFGGMHTAGIYSDMTVDGPEIGTLVLVIDRARNLPNRKTMGKQDPYCAARLGKEAKKTETDKRGGQTPRWDQELRFIVHDSPDYYQLKVSVFNDDKKTDLIGETWVNLEAVVVPGGGQNDLWHNLTCKGRYAGEIRIELTYYDTRPKEDRPVEKKKEPVRGGIEDGERDVLGGPRQSKPVKRRPLPADPTNTPPSRPMLPDHTQSSPLPQISPRGFQTPQGYPQQPSHPSMDFQASHQSLQEPFQRYTQESLAPAFGSDSGALYSRLPPGTVAMAPPAQQPSSNGHEIYDLAGRNDYSPNDLNARGDNVYEENNGESWATHDENQHYSQATSLDDYRNGSLPVLPAQSRHAGPAVLQSSAGMPYALPHSQSAPLMPQHHSVPDFRQHRQQPHYEDRSDNAYGSSPQSHRPIQGSPLRHHSQDDGQGYGRNAMQPMVEDEEPPPPPPPAHRSSGRQTALRDSMEQRSARQSASPAPLNIPNSRGNSSNGFYGDPQAQHHQGSSGYASTASPSAGRGLSQSGTSPSSRTSYNHQERRQSGDAMMPSPIRDGNQAMPPSLVPGYDPIVANEVSERMMQEKMMTVNQSASMRPAQAYQVPPAYDVEPRRHPFGQEVGPSAPTITNSDVSSQAHRPSVPMIKPRAVSPAARATNRKSVSPQPQNRYAPPPEERRLSGIPFSPDSYDTFNPNVAASSTINQPGPQYQTPEQAKHAFRQRQREAQAAEGPIIGTDGRVIDPSDHLPTSTWAPEPEAKTLRKAPEPASRSRPSPQGAQPMPPSTRRTFRDDHIRPVSTPTPIYAHSGDVNTPSPAGRNRLQRKSGISPAQANSSPLVPTISTTPQSLPRTSASEHPLREHEGYGYNSSPTYAGYGSPTRNSPIGPPPIPAKVPIAAGREDYSALSEEMKRIDIGVGGGRIRRSRFGP
ncbi:MAG: hypothetical protein M1827_004182 [Pycnora praestabilis]|nr:MAG: hypothetical protein M1827_004182 [Pycnora praestabilis]